jgi:acyl-CoA synthetase (AMP-forming)/AMP-acid ligase II
MEKVRSCERGISESSLNNEVFITGRLKDLLIVRGQNLYPQDVELCVEQSHPLVRSASAVAIDVAAAGTPAQIVILAEARGAARSGRTDEVRSAIRSSVLRDHGVVLREIALLAPGTLPRGSNGKRARRRCRSMYLAGELSLSQDQEA